MKLKSLLFVILVVVIGILIAGYQNPARLPALSSAVGVEAQESIPSQDAFPTRIVIPTIGVDTVVVNVPRTYDSWDTSHLTWQAGHMEQTAFPGQGSNVVIVAHRYLGYDPETMQPNNPGPFISLDQLGPGNRIQVYSEGSVYIYEVTDQTIIGSADVWILNGTETETLTLMTCTDWNHQNVTFDHVLVVRATLVGVSAEAELSAPVEESVETPGLIARLVEYAMAQLRLYSGS